MILLLQVTTAAVEQYTGEGEPPYCEMTLRATDSDKSALTILQLPVTLIGVRQKNRIFSMRRALVTPDGTPLCTSQPIPSRGEQLVNFKNTLHSQYMFVHLAYQCCCYYSSFLFVLNIFTSITLKYIYRLLHV